MHEHRFVVGKVNPNTFDKVLHFFFLYINHKKYGHHVKKKYSCRMIL